MLTISLCPEWSNAAIAISAGLLFGLITMLVQYVGLFMLGFHSGLLAGLVGLCCVELYYVPPTAWLTLGVLLATGLVFALLTLYFQVKLTIQPLQSKYLKYSHPEKSHNSWILILWRSCSDDDHGLLYSRISGPGLGVGESKS